jgi:hypothetical protein
MATSEPGGTLLKVPEMVTCAEASVDSSPMPQVVALRVGCMGLNGNVPMLYEGGGFDAHLVSLAQMTNSSTTVQLRNAAPLLYSICWQQLI